MVSQVEGSSGIGYAVIIVSCLFVASFAYGWGPVPWTVRSRSSSAPMGTSILVVPPWQLYGSMGGMVLGTAFFCVGVPRTGDALPNEEILSNYNLHPQHFCAEIYPMNYRSQGAPSQMKITHPILGHTPYSGRSAPRYTR